MLFHIFRLATGRGLQSGLADRSAAYAGGSDGVSLQDWASGRTASNSPASLSIQSAVLLMVALTLWRIVMLAFDTTDLFVDEAQYWLWAQHLDFGYYSKPPMIAWVLRGVEEISGSTGIFWIRICGPLFHLATGLVLMQVARRLFDREIAAWTGATFLTLPGVALSSVFFSTDVLLLFFIAVALAAYVLLTERRSVAMAVLLGLAVACAFLSKYAILFVVPGGLVAVACLPDARIAWRDAAIAVAVAAAASLPNIWWNLDNRMITVTHTGNIAHWGNLNPRLSGGLEFLGSQFGVVGPIVFAAILVAAYLMARGEGEWRERMLFFLSVPIIALISLQATVAKAYANWAATAYVAGTVLAVWTLRRVWPQGLKWSLLLNGTVSCLVAMAPIAAYPLSKAGATVMDRYIGRSKISSDAAELARTLLLRDIVSDDRDILADMFYTLRDRGFSLYARGKPGGAPRSYYDQMFSAPKSLGGPVLFVSTHPVDCRSSLPLLEASWQPRTGAYRGKTVYAYRLDAACLTE